MTWRIIRPEGRGYYIITNDVDTIDFIHGNKLWRYGLELPSI